MREIKVNEAYSIAEFCKAYRMSRPHFDKLRKDEKTPQILKIGEKSIITREAVQAWLKKLEKVTEFDQQIDVHFEIFWKLYPKKMDKEAARKSYHEICAGHPEMIDVILEGVKNQLPMWESKDRKFILYPATWLNNKRWQDEITEDDIPIF